MNWEGKWERNRDGIGKEIPLSLHLTVFLPFQFLFPLPFLIIFPLHFLPPSHFLSDFAFLFPSSPLRFLFTLFCLFPFLSYCCFHFPAHFALTVLLYIHTSCPTSFQFLFQQVSRCTKGPQLFPFPFSFNRKFASITLKGNITTDYDVLCKMLYMCPFWDYCCNLSLA